MARFNSLQQAHKPLSHKLFEKLASPGTTSRLTRKICLYSWFQRRTHKLLCAVNRPVVPGSTAPRPEQKVYVYVPFSLPIRRGSCSQFLGKKGFSEGLLEGGSQKGSSGKCRVFCEPARKSRGQKLHPRSRHTQRHRVYANFFEKLGSEDFSRASTRKLCPK